MATKQMVSIIALAFVLSIITVSDIVNAGAPFVITVGDEKGWTVGFDYQAWAQNKQFYVGNALVFNYPQGDHNVIMAVNASAFENCLHQPNWGILESGADSLFLTAPGDMWFFCGVQEHCEMGQKLKITVTESYFYNPPAPAPEA
ncbi:hypothetical protein SUGI_1497060 [Cryptomeria japonica]|uniref:Phytocyanin domain-containing protein n=1 Tax=Cryptomeria japonica TaxID=3369 RepID=A0AAD3NTJ8_CRYJA|nr:mavicyanin-like [Cryptomeria japonica]XP_059072143.1 mavicyanin-like [Cryptomeria japonica]GLJ58727.1 hypothetical protein SUGI_1472390 [Cryptomeria japonica]GLJ59191.1 hypothetical protein SUGI_1497060 [Cryptomeria japonica]